MLPAEHPGRERASLRIAEMQVADERDQQEKTRQDAKDTRNHKDRRAEVGYAPAFMCVIRRGEEGCRCRKDRARLDWRPRGRIEFEWIAVLDAPLRRWEAGGEPAKGARL
eukprot:scaffold105319_cov28-Tisochrysis_lutea.AAC.3